MSARSGGQASLIGATLGGYEVLALVGRGAMGAVYLAKDVALNRQIALKVLLGTLSRSPHVVKKFLKEAKSAAPLNHPNIVRMYSAGIERGIPFIVMEYVDGEPLDRFMKRVGKMKWQNALYIGAQVAEALDCAHRHGIVHRDVKPSNIMLDRHGRVRLTDFGIANVQSEGDGTPSIDAFVGTPRYMSPEQCSGRSISPSSDIYSLGVTLYYMISGTLPFSGETAMAMIKSIISDEPERLNKIDDEIPDDVARLVAYAMEKDPKHRPASAKAVATAIEKLQNRKGGGSVMQEALTKFITDEAKPRKLRGYSASSQKRRGRSKTESRGGTMRAMLRSLPFAVVFFLSFGIGILGQVYARPKAQPDQASVVHSLRLSPGQGGAHVAELSSRDLAFKSVAWVADKQIVIAGVEGREKSINQGAYGIVSINLRTGEFLDIRPPSGPATEARFWRVSPPAFFPQSIPVTPIGSPLHDAFLVQAYEKDRWGYPKRIVTLPQIFDEGQPRPKALFVAPEGDWVAKSGFLWKQTMRGSMVISPSGRHICMVMNDSSYGGSYLVERDVETEPVSEIGVKLSRVDGEIVPESVCYSRDASRIAYMRRGRSGNLDLFVVKSGGLELDGVKLASGNFGKQPAFSPDGRILALTVRNTVTKKESVRLIDSYDGSLIADLGPGISSAAPWHSSSRYLLAISKTADTSQPQVLAYEAVRPFRRATVFTMDSEIEVKDYSVSGDGTWLALITEYLSASVPRSELVFLRVDDVEFTAGSVVIQEETLL